MTQTINMMNFKLIAINPNRKRLKFSTTMFGQIQQLQNQKQLGHDKTHR